MSKHTPGPWVVGDEKRRDPGCIVIHTPEDRAIASAWNLSGPNGEEPDTPMEANARLIAAAPTMLLRLEQCLHTFEKWHELATHEQTLIGLIRKTLGEAKGEVV